MIPRIVPPLMDTTVLVTRPLPQGQALADSIRNAGGEAIVFPAIAIEACEATPPDDYDWVVFASVHAVALGARAIRKTESVRIAAIGKATASALNAADLPADIVPNAPYTSEALLAHPAFHPAPGDRVVIVRGEGGRDALREALTARGATVTTFDVYRRVKPAVTAEEIAALEQRWANEGIDAVTATSVDTYSNLLALLTPAGRELLFRTPLLVPTPRIVDAARASGWNGDALITTSADDAAIVGTLARWRTRARIP
jgi:uroporphyrinogen-III synthase